MKITYVSLWNRDQWKYIRLPHNWFGWKRDGCGHLCVTVAGFSVFFLAY